MAGLKEIRRRLQSVRNTKKITYAMKLVSAAKLRKAQESVQKARFYTDALNQLLADVLSELPAGQANHPYLEKRSNTKSICVLVMGGSRGLCGGYNTNLHKRIESFNKEKDGNCQFFLVGKKPAEYFRRRNRSYLKSYEALSEDANLWPFPELCDYVSSQFLSGAFDEVYLIYTRFYSAITTKITTEKILPLDDLLSNVDLKSTKRTEGQILFEPSPKEVFTELLPRMLLTRVRQAALDAKASEYGNRMTAMDSATKNAGELITKLNLTYNKLRQSGITSELLDIIGGAEALK